MLDGLDEVDWSSIHHAYGPATDVPRLIRHLLSPDSEVRDRAHRELWGNIWHQGTRWEATKHAVPFLVEVAVAPGDHDRVAVVRLISAIAVGFEEAWLRSGFDAAAVRKAQAAWTENPYHVDEIGAYDAVCAAAPDLIGLLEDPDLYVRRAAVFTLAFLPDIAAATLPRIAAIAEDESDEGSQANAILALGLLAAGAAPATNAPRFRNWFALDGPWLVRFAAATGLARLSSDGEAHRFLVDVVATPRPEIDAQGLWWNDGDLVGLAALLLGATDLDLASAETVARALADSQWTEAVTLAAVLLEAAFGGTLSVVPEAAAELSPLQRLAVTALVDTDAWWAGDPHERALFANFGNLVTGWGLPGHAEGLQRWLDGAPLEECLLPGQRRPPP